MARHSETFTTRTVSTSGKDLLTGKVTERFSTSTAHVSSVSSSYDTRVTGGFLRSFCSAILLMLILFNLFAALGGKDNPFTFTRFLNFLGTAPTIDIFRYQVSSITGDWGIFDFFRGFLNTNISILNFLTFFTGSVLNLLVLVFWFVGFIFGF